MTLDIVEQGKSKKNQSSAFFHSLGGVGRCLFALLRSFTGQPGNTTRPAPSTSGTRSSPRSRVGRRATSLARSNTTAGPRGRTCTSSSGFVLRSRLTSRACFGFSDHAVIAEALRAHGMSPSLIAVTWRVSRRGAIAIPTVDRLKRSCPRWWKAMGLPATGKEALEGPIVRGAASGAFTGETKAVTKAYDVSLLSRSCSPMTRRASTRLSSMRISPRRISPRMPRCVNRSYR
jgi:hypothetical protein